MVHRIKGIIRGQRGFTLIELLAVMSILATLVAIVAPAVAGTREASIQAQAQQDATQVRTAANKYFSAQNQSETRTTHKVSTTTKLPVNGNSTADATICVGTTVNCDVATDASQVVSNRWPEKFITIGSAPGSSAESITAATAIGAVYSDIFQTSAGPTVEGVVLLDANSKTLKGKDFLEKFTAVDFDSDTTTVKGLVTSGYLAKKPAGVELTSAGKKNFLWLLTKISSGSAAERKDDSRDVTVFKLVKAEVKEGSSNLILTYQQILGNSLNTD
ncbi:MAG: type II secretion system protein [Chloroflexi bacterium]|nr:type II secretion system protein [Chloroflexota bacterium]